NNGEIYIYLDDGDNSVVERIGSSYGDNTWHHVVVTVDHTANSAIVYVDGVVSETIDITSLTGSLESSEPLLFGSYGGSNSFLNGSMDDVRMYSRVLSADEIADLAAGRHTAATWAGLTISHDY